MDERERQALYEETGLGGDIGENVVAAEYDVAAEQAEGRAGKAERRGTPLVSGVAEGRKVQVTGAAGVARGERTKVNGIAGVALGNRTKLTGYADLVAARDEVEIEKGGAAVVLAGRKVELEDHGYAGIVLAPKVEVEDGGRVLITALAAVLGGLAIGTGLGLVAIGGIWLLSRAGFFQKPGGKSLAARAEAELNRRLRGAVRGALKA